MPRHDFKNFPELRNDQLTELYWESPHKQIFEDFHARVTKVIDGDTIKVKWRERNFDFKVRLANIAAEELADGGVESQRWLEKKILNEEVQILINKKNRVGKWGRLIGEVLHRGVNINEESVRQHKSIEFSQRSLNPLEDFSKELKKFEIK